MDTAVVVIGIMATIAALAWLGSLLLPKGERDQ